MLNNILLRTADHLHTIFEALCGTLSNQSDVIGWKHRLTILIGMGEPRSAHSDEMAGIRSQSINR
jgi:hypothetical protein